MLRIRRGDHLDITDHGLIHAAALRDEDNLLCLSIIQVKYYAQMQGTPHTNLNVSIRIRISSQVPRTCDARSRVGVGLLFLLKHAVRSLLNPPDSLRIVCATVVEDKGRMRFMQELPLVSDYLMECGQSTRVDGNGVFNSGICHPPTRSNRVARPRKNVPLTSLPARPLARWEPWGAMGTLRQITLLLFPSTTLSHDPCC
jgi:hypothetical protein